jgi:hypothetical protein
LIAFAGEASKLVVGATGSGQALSLVVGVKRSSIALSSKTAGVFVYQPPTTNSEVMRAKLRTNVIVAPKLCFKP